MDLTRCWLLVIDIPGRDCRFQLPVVVVPVTLCRWLNVVVVGFTDVTHANSWCTACLAQIVNAPGALVIRC